MKKLLQLAAALLATMLLSACGGDGGSAPVPTVVPSDQAVGVNATNGAQTASSVLSQSFQFSAVPDFGTTQTTTVVFSPRTANTPPDSSVPAENPAFTVTNTVSGEAATGLTEFGSCRFKVQGTSFRSGPLATVGATVTITICELRLDTSGLPSDGVARERGAQLFLDNVISAPVLVTIVVNSTGQFTVNAVPLGTAPLAPVTGS